MEKLVQMAHSPCDISEPSWPAVWIGLQLRQVYKNLSLGLHIDFSITYKSCLVHYIA